MNTTVAKTFLMITGVIRVFALVTELIYLIFGILIIPIRYGIMISSPLFYTIYLALTAFFAFYARKNADTNPKTAGIFSLLTFDIFGLIAGILLLMRSRKKTS